MGRKDSYKKLFESDDAFKAIYKSATEGILLANQKGVIADANPASHSLFGYGSNELIGKSVESLIPTNLRTNHIKMRGTFHKNPTPRVMGAGRDLVGLRKNGTEFPIEVSLSHFEIEGVMFAIAFVIDISVRKNAELELKNSEEKLIVYATELERRVQNRTEQLAESVQNLEKINNELEREIKERKRAEKEALVALEKEKELNEMKSRFVSLASHEFRTPLSTILSSASLIGKYDKEEMNEKRIKHINRIKDNVSEMTGILNDFLSLDKLEAGQVESRHEKIELISFIKEIIAELKTITRRGQIITNSFNVRTYELFIDKSFLKNILNNLISNAIKYSPEGDPIEVSVVTSKSSVTIEVKDYGIGIPEEDQIHLFKRFFRAHNSIHIQGTGLGLNLVKRYIDLLGGSISFKSEVGKGSTFMIKLLNNLTDDENNTTN
ncbi:MAG TPA: PAS domain-containing sensor histidine kinase [Cyclobacteriaceae bacterium]